ncbi:MAG: helix-turn-helix domain-containing protein [Cryobacterium sp.]|nr:helix-turn-helix domain-containing protein [Cryobacterium sp.]
MLVPAVQSEEVAQRLADHMVRWRHSHSLSMEAAAARVGLALQQWDRWESGSTKNPTLKSLMRIAEAMETDLPSLIADLYWPPVENEPQQEGSV